MNEATRFSSTNPSIVCMTFTKREALIFLESVSKKKKLTEQDSINICRATQAIKDNVFHFKDLVDTYIESKTRSKKFSPLTARNYRYMAGKFFGELMDKDVREATGRTALEDFRKKVISNKDIKDELKQRIIRFAACVVKYGYYSKLVSEDDYKDSYVVLEPIRVYKTLESEKTKRLAWCPDEIKAFISVLPKDKRDIDRVMFRVLLATGVRIGELLGLKTTSFDYNNDTVLINCQVYEDGTEHETKNKEERKEYIPHELGVMIKQYIKARRIKEGSYLFCAPWNHVRSNKARRGTPMTANAVRSRLYRLEAKAGVRINVPHGFRVTQSTLLFNSCTNLDEAKAVAKRLGHSYKTALNYYQRVMNDNQKEIFMRSGLQVI